MHARPRRADPRPHRGARGRPGSRCGSSFRRCRHGVCGVFGQHWGGPEGDEFGRAAAAPGRPGRRALLINCLPPDHVLGHAARGCATSRTCRSASIRTSATTRTTAGASTSTVDGDEYGEMAVALAGRRARRSSAAAAARGPSTSAGARARVRDMPLGRRRPLAPPSEDAAGAALDDRRRARRRAAAVARRRGPPAVPARDPRVVCEPGVFVPTHGSFSCGSTSSRTRIGEGKRCLDIGCGTGTARHRARAQRRRARARDRRRPPRGGQHAVQRLPQRRRRPHHRARRSTSTRGCPRTATTSSSRASTRCPSTPTSSRTATARWTSGGATCSTTSSRCCRRLLADGRRRLRHAALDPRPGAHGRAARRGRLRSARRRLRVLRVPLALRAAQGARSTASRTSPTPTTCTSATRTYGRLPARGHRQHDEVRRHRVPVHLGVGDRGPSGQGRRPDLRRRARRRHARRPDGRVACETLVNTGLVVVSGEISTTTYVDIQEVARETIRGIGYIDADLGFSRTPARSSTRSTSSRRTSRRASTAPTSAPDPATTMRSTSPAPATRG